MQMKTKQLGNAVLKIMRRYPILVIIGTGKSFSEALILASTHPQYDKRLFIDLPVLTRKLQAQNMLCTYIVFLFLHSKQCMYTTCSELVVFM